MRRQQATPLCAALVALTTFAALLTPARTAADDIDIFIGSSGGLAAAPNIMFLLDATNDWRQDRPAGDAVVNATVRLLDSLKSPMKIGLAMATVKRNPTTGAYIRFAPRDMSVAKNKTGLQNILRLLYGNAGAETDAVKDEAAALYEIYKYYSALRPYAGAPNTAINPNVDAAGNSGTYPGATAHGQGLADGGAFKSDGTYNGSTTPCGKTYIIYIAYNSSSNGVAGRQTYEATSAGPALLPAPGNPDSWADEWARFLYISRNPQIVTYVLDKYFPDDNQDIGYSKALEGLAKQGGGSYKHVRDETEIYNELLRIFGEIQAVNSTFASASLPVSASTRSQNLNQVYTGVFRPDPDAKPRWFGNMKRYQLIAGLTGIDLGDATGQPAVNPNTGFITDCATSYWTSDSSSGAYAATMPYWQGIGISPDPLGACPTTSFSPYSDAPDGPLVEKGGVAEVIRKGNNPPATNSSPTWTVSRRVKSVSAGRIVDLTAASSGLPASTVDWILGRDAATPAEKGDPGKTRPSLHGDVIHSRALPINYGAAGITVYYGANDGAYRAVDAETGKERWAFVAPEFFSKVQRLMDNSPLVSYPNIPTTITPTPRRKDYFFDGSTGIYQNRDSTKVWIYPSMRRGGRMIYALDVTSPAADPVLKWSAGCPKNLVAGEPYDDTGCTAGLSDIGQTWSTPNVAFIKGYSAVRPVVVLGGGYDPCEDTDRSAPACPAGKGAALYVLDADSGALVRTFTAVGMRSVVADVTLADVNFDGFVDYAYAVTSGGQIYRLGFVDGPATVAPLAPAVWTFGRAAVTSGAGRKFLFAPAVLQNAGKMYVAIGSGDREHPLEQHYPFRTRIVNRFYVYVDDLAASPADTNLDDPVVMADYTSDTGCNAVKILPGSTRKGWFMDLTGAGEQTVTDAVIAGGMATFSTNRPIPAAAGSCATTLGEARGYFVNLLNASGAIGVAGSCGGRRYANFAGGGLPPSPVLATVVIGGVQRTVLIGAIQKSGAASSPIAPQLVIPPVNPRRIPKYWFTPDD